MLSLKCAETKPDSSSCSVISLMLYTQAEAFKILVLKVYNGSHCYFISPISSNSSHSAKLDRYRCLGENNILILSFCYLAVFSNCFSEDYSISNIPQKKIWHLPGSWGCSHSSHVDATTSGKELCSRTTLANPAWRSVWYQAASYPCIYRGCFWHWHWPSDKNIFGFSVSA